MFGLELPTLISRIFTLIIAFTVHEFSHAKVADWFGDDTPRMNGRLTLNPLKHLDIFGSLMLVIAGFGWAKPVPVNPYALSRRSPAGYMWVSLAGPASNLFMAIVAAAPLRLNWIGRFDNLGGASFLPTPYEFLSEFIFINLLLMLFNLIPLAPLDGDKIYSYFAPPPIARALDVIRPYGPIVLMLLVFLAPRFGVDVFGWMMSPALPNLWNLLLGGSA
ncbi:MAG TPA: site-2 protease family protein [Bellilinea sp.]